MWDHCHGALNKRFGNTTGPGLVSITNSRVRAFWHAAECRAEPPHVVYCTPGAISDRPWCLVCTVCNLERVATIQGLCRTIDIVHEPQLWALMHAEFAACVWAVQCRSVVGWKGSVDMAVFGPTRTLVVQVDGSSHTARRRRLRLTLEQ